MIAHRKLWSGEKRWLGGENRRWRQWLAAAAGLMTILQTEPTSAQRLPSQDCIKPGEPLIRMPELRSKNGKLRATILLTDELRRLNDTTVIPPVECAEVFLRFFQGVDTVAPAILPGVASPPAAAGVRFKDPVPGPTLRARVGDIVQLTFLNQVDPLNHAGTLDRGADAGACDQFSVGSGSVASDRGYPGNANDTFPNCFHGSSTANIHFHGTHTNPNSTGDNVFLNVRPSPRRGGKPTVTAESVKASFDRFFSNCEYHLKQDILSEWPRTWSDLPSAWTREQRNLLQAYDAGKPEAQKLWPENQRQIDSQRWPQYYVGAFPFCFLLPEYTATTWPPPAGYPLKMGQAPGLHWYHAHKHGSTALNVANGMTGAFLIEGKYDDDLNEFYGKVGDELWTRAQPVLVINQLGGTPNLARNAVLGAQDLSVNGRLQPKLTMRPGEVQLWRIVNTSSRTFTKFLPPTDGLEWRQLAQDGVQFADVRYQASQNTSFILAPGNRADILVKAPMSPPAEAYKVMVEKTVAKSGGGDGTVALMSIEIAGMPPENPKQREFMGQAPIPPPFLADITDDEVKYSPRRTLVFDSKGMGQPHQHTINGEQFSDSKIGVTVFLNTVEEWKVVNTTASFPNVDHPFHIHVNPFQVVEIFDPNELLLDAKGRPLVDKTGQPAVDAAGKPLAKYVLDQPAFPDLQCQLKLNDQSTWRDCHNVTQRFGAWWDVFPIPAGRPLLQDGAQVIIPGYFRMRSRFVDYPGLYVLHCHILAHEDRGMMTIVEVMKPRQAPPRHH